MVLLDPPQSSSAAPVRPLPDFLRMAADSYYYKPFATLFAWRELTAYAEVAPVFRPPVLDVGCSDGTFAHLLRRAFELESPFTGVDLDNAALAAARRERPDCFDRLIRAPAEQLPFDSASFQTVICNGMLQATDEPGAVLRELARVVATGGTVYCTVPTEYWPQGYWPRGHFRRLRLGKVDSWYVRGLSRRLGHRHEWPVQKWERVFTDNGFVVEEQRGFFAVRDVRRWSLLAMNALRVNGLLRTPMLRVLRKPASAAQCALFSGMGAHPEANGHGSEVAYTLIVARRAG